MNLQPLADKIREPQYSGLPDQQIADAINSLRVIVRRPVPTWLVRQQAIENGYWPALVEASESTATASRSLAIAVLAWIDDRSGTIQTVDLDRPSVVQMRAALVAAGIVSQVQADGLATLADTSIPWTESVGLPEVGIGLIQNARRMTSG